jgi:hypothetical protein
MDCPICHGNGELEYSEFQCHSNTEREKDVSEYRGCFGSTVSICFRCCGSGYLECNE